MPIVRGAQMQIGDVCINLRRRNIAVPEQRLNRTRIRAVLQEMRGKAVSQRVRRHILDSRGFRMSLDHGPCELPRERPPAMREDIRQRLLSVSGFDRRILLQPVNRAFPKRHATLFVSLSMTHDQARKQVNVRLFQRDELRNAQSRRIHDLEHRAIAYALRRRNVGRCE